MEITEVTEEFAFSVTSVTSIVQSLNTNERQVDARRSSSRAPRAESPA
jgi:hypothetical protein